MQGVQTLICRHPIWAAAVAIMSCLGCGAPEASSSGSGSPANIKVIDQQEGSPLISAQPSDEVDYYNPNTGYSADYILDVEWVGDQVERINFSNGGWEDDFADQVDNGDGTVTVTDEEGREFTVEKDADLTDGDFDDDEVAPPDEE